MEKGADKMKIPPEQNDFFLKSDIGKLHGEFLQDEVFFKNYIVLNPYRVKWINHKSMDKNYFGDNNSIEDDIIESILIANNHIFDELVIKLHVIIKQSLEKEYYELASRLTDVINIIKKGIEIYETT